MSTNLFKLFSDLIPKSPLQVCTVQSSSGGVVTAVLPGGATVQARGAAANGTKVFIRDGVIEGAAPNLTVELIDV
jgi:hypothetical protein